MPRWVIACFDYIIVIRVFMESLYLGFVLSTLLKLA